MQNTGMAVGLTVVDCLSRYRDLICRECRTPSYYCLKYRDCCGKSYRIGSGPVKRTSKSPWLQQQFLASRSPWSLRDGVVVIWIGGGHCAVGSLKGERPAR